MIGNKTSQKETLNPASLQYFISSLASTTVGLGNNSMGFIRRINHDSSHQYAEGNEIFHFDGIKIFKFFIEIVSRKLTKIIHFWQEMRVAQVMVKEEMEILKRSISSM